MLLKYFLLILLAASSIIILFQDFKQRLVSLWAIILFGAVCITSVVYYRGFNVLLYNLISVALYFSIIWLFLKLYFYIKFKRNKPLLDEQIGLADILIIVFIGLTFNIVGTIFFFCLAFIASLISFYIFTISRKKEEALTIPLAGLLVFFYLFGITTLNVIETNYLIDCSFVNPSFQ